MVMRMIDPVAVRIALDECRQEAQKCIEEAADAPTKADWLALAEQWVSLAERLRDQARWLLSPAEDARQHAQSAANPGGRRIG
jgi:hypothetical protein